jgi:hypothetical protein
MTKLALDIDLPHDPDFEAQALGTALSGRGGYGLLATLAPDDFHDALNRSAWAVIEAIGKAVREPDLMTVDAELRAASRRRWRICAKRPAIAEMSQSSRPASFPG